jgi:hypothetical protein
MPRLNNKDFTVDELERLIYLINNTMYGPTEESTVDEIKALLRGTTISETPQEPQQIVWNFNFKIGMNPHSFEQGTLIKNAMRSSEVNENIKRRFGSLVYEEINWYQDRVKVFIIKGDSNILE